jgi:hypothetical protein
MRVCTTRACYALWSADILYQSVMVIPAYAGIQAASRVGVMPENEAVVLRDTDIGLNSAGAELHSLGKRCNGILWNYEGSATVPE